MKTYFCICGFSVDIDNEGDFWTDSVFCPNCGLKCNSKECETK